jgi:hypothetical protein
MPMGATMKPTYRLDRFGAAFCFCFLGCGAFLAQPRAQSSPAQIPTKDVMAQLAVDFDQDGIMDRLVVTKSEDGGDFGDLHVFKGEKEAGTGRETFLRLSVTKEFGYGIHSVEEKRKGVITIASSHAQGRYPWEQTLTLAWRGGKLVVLGVTYSSFDRISDDDDKASAQCDLNLATGRGTGKKNRPVRVTLKPVPVAEWTDDMRPEICDG